MDEVVFVDYYEVLQVNPGCNRSILESAYRSLAKQYHPDHPETADPEMFQLVIDAYNTLKRQDKRAEYDLVHASRRKSRGAEPDVDHGYSHDSKVAASDGYLQQNIMLMLYKQRRNNAKDPGVNAYHLQSTFRCTDDNFEFHIWYLKSKGFVSMDEQGMLAITIEGVDHVISTHQHESRERLLIEQSGEREG